MAIECTTSREASAERAENRLGQPSDTNVLSAKLAVENQAGTSVKKCDAPVQQLEYCDSRKANADSSKEPISELSFSLKPLKEVVAHGSELGEVAQKLAVGGQIQKTADKIEIEFSKSEKITLNTTSGKTEIDSPGRYQKEVHFEGTPWQRTIFTSNTDTRITVGSQGISSIERDGMMEIFPKSYSKQIGSEPRMPASEELLRKLSEKSKTDLQTELNKVDRQEGIAQEAVAKGNSDNTSVTILSETIKERGLFLEKAAAVLPNDAQNLDACAENQLRIALRKMREQFGAGTPEAKGYAEALQNFLKTKGNADQAEEIQRLAFEARRGGLMKNVVDSIEKTPDALYRSMAPEQVQLVHKSLISVHIAGGDAALKSFVNDVNKRLSFAVMTAPVPQGGFLHFGAITLTPEGATRYNGSFNIVPKPKN